MSFNRFKEGKIKTLIFFFLISLIIYNVVIFSFAILYFKTKSISENILPSDFFDSFYFSFVSFHTIGFGDIHPISRLGKELLFIESILSLFFTSIFSGLLVYYLIKRPHNLMITRNIFIRLKRDSFYLSCRIGNKGKDVIDASMYLEAFYIKNNIRTRFYHKKLEVGVLEQSFNFDLKLEKAENQKLLEHLVNAKKFGKLLIIRVTLWGIDSATCDNVVTSKSYKTQDIKFGSKYIKTGDWDENGNRLNMDLSGFNKVEDFESNEIKNKFDDFLKTVSNRENTPSV